MATKTKSRAKTFTLGYIGLGKMGLNMTYNLLEQGHTVIANNRSKVPIHKAKRKGAIPAYSTAELFEKLNQTLNLKNKKRSNKQTKRIIWLMLPAGEVTEHKIKEIKPFLKKGDIIIDGSNSLYTDAKRRAKTLAKKGINFVDIGVSGGPKGARKAACMMVGGKKTTYNYLKPLLQSITTNQGGGLEHFVGAGAGHYVKMVHNGIEYGIMESLAEGFAILKRSPYKPNLTKVAQVYQHGSIIESKLMQNLLTAFQKHKQGLKGVPGAAGQGGKSAGKAVKAEANWTVDEAKRLRTHYHAIADAIKERKESRKHPSFRGKIINAIRNQFGGHALKTKKNKSSK